MAVLSLSDCQELSGSSQTLVILPKNPNVAH